MTRAYLISSFIDFLWGEELVEEVLVEVDGLDHEVVGSVGGGGGRVIVAEPVRVVHTVPLI